MRKTASIFSLILLYFLCSSKSCTDEDQVGDHNPEGRIEVLKDSIANQFEADQLTSPNLRILEEAAIQKLSEWSDYLRIAADTSMAQAFRDKALDMARNLFLPEDSARSDWSKVLPPATWAPDSVRVNRPLTLAEDNRYSGSLMFYPIITASTGAPVAGSPKTIGIHAVRVQKVFGTDTLKLWNVYLGELTD